jgi:hypothetical protein
MLGKDFLIDMRADFGAVTHGEIVGRSLDLARPHVVGGRIDKVAREIHRLDGARKLAAIDPVGDFEAHLFGGLRAVTAEAISAEGESERRKPRIRRGIGKAIDPARQQSRQPPGGKRIAPGGIRLVAADQHCGEAARRVGEQDMPLGFRLEPCRIRKSAGLIVELRAQGGPTRLIGEPDRNGGATALHESRMHEQMSSMQASLLTRRLCDCKASRAWDGRGEEVGLPIKPSRAPLRAPAVPP